MEVTDVKKHFSDANAPMRNIVDGLRDGTPIALGYFAVAFSLGIIAKKAGLTAPMGFFSSFFTRASAGEYGVYTLVAIHATYVELIAMCLVTNLRYMLMSAALSQKLAPATSWFHRLLMACCITDEIFGISVNHRGYPPLPTLIRQPSSPPSSGQAAVPQASWQEVCFPPPSLQPSAWHSMACFWPSLCLQPVTTATCSMPSSPVSS